MNAWELEYKLTDFSVRTSGYDEHRDYIGLSGVWDCPLVIYRRYFNRMGVSTEARLKTKYSYEVEDIIKRRLRAMGILSPSREISLYDGLVKGHTEGEILGRLFDVKTVAISAHFPNGQLPYKVRFQMNAYMKYGPYPDTLVIYFARDSGLFKAYDLFPDSDIQIEIVVKLEQLVEAVRNKRQPKCECGRCR